MAEQKQTVREIAGDLLLKKRQQLGDAAAQRLERPSGAAAMTKPEQQAAFWYRAMTPEQESAMLAAGQSKMAVSAAVYPRRWELWNAEGTSLTDKLRWAKEMVKLGPPDVSARNAEQSPETPSATAEGSY